MLAVIRDTVRKIPKGRVSTYGEIAQAAGFPGCARQVVWALRQASPGLPWHRVVAAGGRIALPGANGLEQRVRLESEGVAFRGARVWMQKHQHEFDRTRPRKKKPAANVESRKA